MTKILISAYHLCHAEYYAREVLHIGRSTWRFIQEDWDIRGLRGAELILVHAKRHRPTRLEFEKRAILKEACLAWGINIKQVELP